MGDGYNLTSGCFELQGVVGGKDNYDGATGSVKLESFVNNFQL